jgi:hypothetical protein
MGPFIAIAASVLPEILRHVSGAAGQAERDVAEQAVSAVVQAVTKETDPDAARKKVTSDPDTEAQLRVRLSELAASLDNARQSARDSAHNAALQGMEQRFSQQMQMLSKHVDAANDAHAQSIRQVQQEVEDSSTAKTVLSSLVSPRSPSVIAAPILSGVVLFGFFLTLGFILSDRFDPNADSSKLQIVNIVIGALTAGFATVVNFWMGSSQGSKNKDLASFSLQHLQALQAGRQAAAQPQSNAPPEPAAPDTVTAPPARTGQAPPAPPPKAVKDAAFQTCVQFVLKHEGGFVNNPEDPGGATNMGITLGTLQAWCGHAVTVEDVRNLTQSEAEQIYRANYWNPLKCDELPLGVDMVVFDFGVNAGIRRSALTLEQVVGVAQDGIIGPETLAAVGKADALQVVEQFGQTRLAYYKRLKEWPEFGKGWSDRVTECQAEARTLMSSTS